jgi:thiol:disulfide interchange protein DsbG
MVLSIAIAVLPFTFPARAKETQPDPNANAMLANFIKQGAKPFYMGQKGGIDGWLLVKDGKSQVVYQVPGSQYLLVGMLFQPNGDNITFDQVKETTEKNKEIASLFPETPAAKEAKGSLTALPAGTAALGAAMPAVPPMSPVPAPAAQENLGEKLVKDLLAASGVTLGPSSAPQLLMVMDPNCKHCRATWGLLRDAVLKGKLEVHMIPIGAEGSDNERAAAEFLHKSDPLSAWDKYYNGDDTQLAGTPDPSWIASVQANHALIDSWNIDTTPMLVYRSKSGEVKIIKGEIQQPLAVILSDMAAP